MGKLIQDVTPAYVRGYGTQARLARRMKAEVLVSELYRRGVRMTDIFGQYYALEEQAGARDDDIFGNDEDGQHGAQLTVGDALLVTPTPPSKTPLGEMPF